MMEDHEDRVGLVTPDNGQHQAQQPQQLRRRCVGKLPQSCSMFLVALCSSVFLLWYVPSPFCYLPMMTVEAGFRRRSSIPKDDKRRPPQYAPVIINADMGTTGTHSFFFATCMLCYPSLHWFTVCVLKHAVVEILLHKMQKKNHYLRLKDDG